ncbi:MAG TPA: TVP38/TMEM64 family protein [Candidatus Binatia bacterium]|nr:TVP38/TMEM64 family protein [Candidatus Binatia bacterium]
MVDSERDAANAPAASRAAADVAARRSPVVAIAVVVVAVAAVALVFRLLPVAEWLARFQSWVQGLGTTGYALYALVYAACCVLFVPASILTLGAGAIYGVTTGVAVVLVGATLGAALSFLLARTLLRDRIERMTRDNARFAALDRAIGKEGAKIVFLVRLAPIFPFTYINYAFGLTRIALAPYVIASFVGMIPGTFAYVYLGTAAAAAGAAATGSGGAGGATRTAIQIAGAVFAVVATVFVARVATRAIREAGVADSA